MFQLNIKKLTNFDNLLNNNYTIHLINYIIDKNNENYIIDKKIIIQEKDKIYETDLYSINQIYTSDIISQLPFKYHIDSNVLVKIDISNKQKLMIRGLLNLEKINKNSLTKISLSEILKILLLKEVYILKKENSFEEELKSFNLIK